MIEVLEFLELGEQPALYKKISLPSDDDSFGWCVLKHRPRGNPGMFDPDEFILQDHPQGDDIGNGIPFKDWWGIAYQINKDYPGAWEWLTDYEAMFFNNDQNPEERKIDITKPINIRCSSGGGNLKKYYKATETDTHVQIAAYDYSRPGLATGQDFYTNPEYWTFPTCINESGIIRRMTTGITVFVPQVARFVEGMPQLWARKDSIIKIDKPMFWGASDVMDARWV